MFIQMFYHLSKLKYPFALQECLSHDAQRQYKNTMHQRKNLNSPRHFQFLPLKSQDQAV